MRQRLLPVLVAQFLLIGAASGEPVAIIAHGSMPKTDLVSLQRLYTGRTVSISRQSAVPVNLPAGHPVRQQFLEMLLAQDEEQYTAYWLVRRYVGKGAPPQEAADVDELLRFVASTPGAVGYLPLSKVPSGANIIFKR